MHNNYCTGLKCLINELHYSVLVLLQSLAVLNIDCQSRFQNFQYVRYYHNIVILHDIVDCSTAEQQTVSTHTVGLSSSITTTDPDWQQHGSKG